jgi:hypothetical protein
MPETYDPLRPSLNLKRLNQGNVIESQRYLNKQSCKQLKSFIKSIGASLDKEITHYDCGIKFVATTTEDGFSLQCTTGGKTFEACCSKSNYILAFKKLLKADENIISSEFKKQILESTLESIINSSKSNLFNLKKPSNFKSTLGKPTHSKPPRLDIFEPRKFCASETYVIEQENRLHIQRLKKFIASIQDIPSGQAHSFHDCGMTFSAEMSGDSFTFKCHNNKDKVQLDAINEDKVQLDAMHKNDYKNVLKQLLKADENIISKEFKKTILRPTLEEMTNNSSKSNLFNLDEEDEFNLDEEDDLKLPNVFNGNTTINVGKPSDGRSIIKKNDKTETSKATSGMGNKPGMTPVSC